MATQGVPSATYEENPNENVRIGMVLAVFRVGK